MPEKVIESTPRGVRRAKTSRGAVVVDSANDMADKATRAPSDFSRDLIAWQHTHGRHTLPWQRTRDPYRVWLSEIMLQQTQVATVLGYYERFLDRYPDVAALAAAPQGDVLALWSGLGYYSRARNLLRCAQAVVAEHGGAFPASSTVLATLPGIGRSTAAAIAAFCFGERVAILDGNVKRVLTRVLAFEGDLAVAAQERRLWDEATRLLPETDIESYTQGVMDLGATVCLTRSPQCLICPVIVSCAAARAGTQTQFPVRTRKLKRSRREHVWLWLQWRGKTWLAQRPQSGIWAGMVSLPEFDSTLRFDEATADWPGSGEALDSFTHTLTHLDLDLHPIRWRLPDRIAPSVVDTVTAAWPEGAWFSLDEALNAGLPAPLRKLLETTR